MEEFHSKMGHPQFVEKRHTIKKKQTNFAMKMNGQGNIFECTHCSFTENCVCCVSVLNLINLLLKKQDKSK